MSIDTCLLPERSATRAVIEAVEEYAVDYNSHIHRSDTYNWEEYEELTFDGHGYLDCTIEYVHITEIVYECGVQTFYVSASVYAGECREILIGDPGIYEAYQDDNGEWIIEWHGC